MVRIAACLAAVCALTFDVQAQSTSSMKRVDPADPNLAVPVGRYQSPYSTYQRFEEQKPASWRALNDEVERLGGHPGHIKDPALNESARSDAPPQTGSSAPPVRSTEQAPPPASVVAPKPVQPPGGGAHRHHH